MKMNPSIFFFLFFFIFVFFFFLLLVSGAAHLDMNCQVSSCGDIANISYPFWLRGKQPSYCGFPDFVLQCEDDIPLIEMPSGEHRVKKIFYENNSLIVANDELARSECPVIISNLSFAVTPFAIIPSVNRDLYFLHNCSHVDSPDYFKVGCATTDNGIAYFVYLGGDYGAHEYVNNHSCSAAAHMPVLGYPRANSSQYRTLLRNGFLLNYTVADCEQCTASNGQCGYSNETKNFICICSDRLHWKSCTGIHLPCRTDINISYPFYTNNSLPGCNTTYLIQCIESKPTIQFQDYSNDTVVYTVKNISYSDKTITLVDPDFPIFHPDSDCSFLYNFTYPVPHFDRPHRPIIDSLDRSISSCTWRKEDFSLLSDNYDYSICHNFSFYYWNESEKVMPKGASSVCHAPVPPLFEFKLSFNELDEDGLSLLSAGFSHSLELRPDCFHDTLCTNSCYSCTKSDAKNGKAIAIGASLGAAALIAVCCAVLCWCKRRNRLQQFGLSKLLSWNACSKFSSTEDTELGESNYHTHIFSYNELEEATNGFDVSRELGDGGFGTVYKGKLRDGRTVAVKRLYENNYRRLQQFMNEVDILSRLRHQNLVTLYGCTSRHSRELLLVYEYIPNGTVADHLHGTHAASAAGPLPWHSRISIAIETADALAYLHAVEPQIIHRDVKSNNILLDNNFHVKVADFGLSRLFPLDATHVSTAPQGTPGYLDPEYHQCYQLTDKSDVYSFGVVLVELISSKPAVDISRTRHEINLANMAVSKIQKSELDQLVDPSLGYHSDLEVKRMITQVAELAFTCLQSDGDLRPSIKEVLEILRGIENGSYKRPEEEDQKKGRRYSTEEAAAFSPDTVTQRWHSRSTTPSNSNSISG